MKFIKSLIISYVLILISTTSVIAVDNLSVRIQNPDTPTNQKDFKLSFVAMDLEDRGINVTCYKKGPSDGSFVQFDSTKSLSPGGNSGHCQVTYNQISPIGTYEFYAIAKAGTDSTTSNTVSIDYNNQRPGTPSNYSKEKISDCTYRIKFKTADDNKTTKVEIYRSENMEFDLNNSTKVGEVALGPNQEGEYNNTLPDCSKSYYFAIRAFDTNNNTSDPVGDNISSTTTNTTITITLPNTVSGAIPVSSANQSQSSSQGSVLGESDKATESSQITDSTTEDEGVVMGATDNIKEALKQTNNKVILGIGIITLALILFFLYKKRFK